MSSSTINIGKKNKSHMGKNKRIIQLIKVFAIQIEELPTPKSMYRRTWLQLTFVNSARRYFLSCLFSSYCEFKFMSPATTFGGRAKFVLLTWQGSVLQCMWRDTLIYIALYYILSITYREVRFYNY